MKWKWAGFFLWAAIVISPGVAGAATVDQWASTVISVSSQWSSSSWSAEQALGAPNTFGYGDISTAWAPGPSNGTKEYITLGFATPVYASQVTIRETWGNGFVYRIDLLDMSDTLHTIWAGSDPSLPGAPVDFTADWAMTGYLTKGVKIYVDTDHDLGAWEEIDAVRLTGSPVPIPGAILLLGSGIAGLAACRRSGKSWIRHRFGFDRAGVGPRLTN